MRVFFALLVLTGIITALTIVDLFYDRQELAQERGSATEPLAQVSQGADPSLTLEPTAAGIGCDQDRFYYGQSANGYNFIKEYGGNIYVTRNDNQMICLQSTESGYVARRCNQPPRGFGQFKQVLLGCTKSDLVPTASGISFVF